MAKLREEVLHRIKRIDHTTADKINEIDVLVKTSRSQSSGFQNALKDELEQLNEFQRKNSMEFINFVKSISSQMKKHKYEIDHQ